VSLPSMVNHCVRTYRFGEALGLKFALKPDWEVLYIAALLHDLGLEARYDGPGDFEANGAKAAEQFLLAQGARSSLAALVRSAIDVHTQLVASEDARPEVKLLHLGAMCDAIGGGLEQLPAELVQQILHESPRLDWKKLVAELIAKQIAAKPNCRAAMVERQFGFLERIRNAPFPE
jgi:hypothetical protein